MNRHIEKESFGQLFHEPAFLVEPGQVNEIGPNFLEVYLLLFDDPDQLNQHIQIIEQDGIGSPT